MAALPLGALAQTTSLASPTTIVFDATTAGVYQGTDETTGGETTFTNYSLAYYGISRTVTSIEGAKSGTVGGADYSASKYISMNSTAAWTSTSFTKRTAGGNNLGNNTFAPVVAFNTALPGKVYVSVQRRGAGNGSMMLSYQTEAAVANQYKLVALDTKTFADDENVKEYEYDIPKATTVLIRGNMLLYAIRFVPTEATTIWKFEQYEANAAIFKEAGVAASAGQYIYGLYFHSRDKKSDSHGIIAKLAKVTNEDLNTHFGTYKKNTDYMGALIGTGGGSAPGESTEAGTSTTVDGVSYKAPAAGKFYATVVRSANTSVIVYKNGTVATQVTFSDETPAKELEVEVAAGDNIYLISPLSGGKQFYLWNAGFVPTSATAVTKTVNVSSAGYASFSATQNYDLPDGLEAYIVSDVNETTATMTQVNEIPACTGVILKGAEDEYTLTSKETTSVDVSSNMLKANIADYNLPTGGTGKYNYILTSGGFVPTTGSGILGAGKAFLQCNVAPGGTGSKLEFVFGEESVTPEDGEETDGISSVEAGMINTGYIYDLSGRRVVAPTKGLYIVNGKKVIIK